MNRFNLKGKILVVLFILFLIMSDIMFHFEQFLLAGTSFIPDMIFAILLVNYHKNNFK